MKNVVKVLLFVFLILGFMQVDAHATTDPPSDVSITEQVISEIEGGYLLSYNGKDSVYASLAECISAIEDPALVVFSGVNVREPIILPAGKYVISGELYSECIISVPHGADVTANNLTLTLDSSANVRIKGGSLKIESSSIIGGGQLIRLDYSSSSYLEVISGVLSGKNNSPLIDVENGRAVIRGADIENKGGAAIKSDSELCIMGSPKISGATYGIILESPMYMGANVNEYYSSVPLTVQYMDTFDEGTLTEVFYEANERSLVNVRLFDKDGKEESVTHFEKTKHTTEKNFAGVYLPHIVRFYIGSELVAEQKLISGERISPVSAEDVHGYEFDNWYRDREGKELYSQGKSVYSSFSLYGRYTLIPPSFSISSKEFTYDGKDHDLAFDSLSHPLTGGYYTYTWYKGEDEISNLSRISIRDVSDGGIYSCRVTYNYNGDSASAFAKNIKIIIKKQSVSIPVIQAVKYSGLPQHPGIPPSDLYSVSETSGTDAGTYYVSVTLTDAENYAWSGSEGKTVNVSFEILKADNLWVSYPTASDSYIGLPIDVSAVPLFGEVKFLYSATANGVYTTELPTSIGSYYVKAAVVETKNYSPLLSDPIQFKIMAEEVVGLELLTPPLKKNYFAFDKFETEGLEVAAIYNSGRREVISNSRLKFTYNDGKELRVGDSSVAVEYLGVSLPISVQVAPLTYDLTALNFNKRSVTYDGSYHSISFSEERIIGLDGIPLLFEISGGGTDVGEYQITVKFRTESKDYVIPSSVAVILTVNPCTVELSWESTQFVYDSTPKLPSATFVDVKGVKRDVSVCGSAILAGDGYSATATPFSDNYVYSNPVCSFNISKADYDMSNVKWSSAEFTYTGVVREVVLTDLPLGISVVGYTDNRATNAGKYTATASLKYDEKNYNPPKAPSCEWTIKPAEYDMSTFEILSAEYEYDGMEHFPEISGSLPIGADGTTLTYTFTKGATNVSDGVVTVFVKFSTDSENYVVPKEISSTVKIYPKGIYVVWTADDFIYDGKAKLPSAESPFSKIRVSGSNVNAGVYLAYAESADQNYSVINSSFEYEIKKAENRWVSYPSISDFYESREPAPSATPYFGKAEFKYYSDASASEIVSVDTYGEYYMIATVPESENYLALSSSPIKFTCIEVIPIGITIEKSGVPIAFSDIKNYLSVYLNYNDGARTLAPRGEISVKYQNGDYLLYKDTCCEISYGGFCESISLNVDRATYDLSSVRWDNIEAIYDGMTHSPILIGLPKGINILGYIGEAGVNAGEYHFSASLSYDEENYYPPEVSDCVLVIKKALVSSVPDVTAEYSGQPLDINNNDLYSATIGYDIINSGEYIVTYALNDKENYAFESGSCECTAKITVLPRQIRVIVSDVKIHLLESEPEYSSKIEGDVLNGDSLDLQYYVENDKVYVRSSNNNYLLIVDSGDVERVPYPNEEMRGKIIALMLVILIIACIVVILFKKRTDIVDAFYMFKARKKYSYGGMGYIDNAPADPKSIVSTPQAPITINLSTAPADKSTNLVSIDSTSGTIFLSASQTAIIPKIESPVQRISLCREKEETTKEISINGAVKQEESANEDDNRENVAQKVEGKDTSKDSNDEYGVNPLSDIAVKTSEKTIDMHENARETCEDNEDAFMKSGEMKIDEGVISINIATDVNEGSNKPDLTNRELCSSSEVGDCTVNDIEDTSLLGCYESNSKDGESVNVEEPRVEIKMEYANSVISDAMARRLIKNEREVVYTDGRTKSIINVDTLSRNFVDDERVDVNILKKKSLVPYDTNYIKVLARGAIDKPLRVHANEFSLSAVKMILLSGGEAIRVISEKEEKNKTKK